MKQHKILTLIMAGGAGGRMGALTDHRAKPVLPFGGVYRLIDFPLSNCVHSGLDDIWVIEQFQAPSLNFHLANGRPWDLDRTYGGLEILPPYQGDDQSGWHEGNASAIYRNRRVIGDFDPDLILVLSADHIYKLDYREVIAAHLERQAELTLVTTEVPKQQASRFGNVVSGGDGKVKEFVYKPEQPVSKQVTTEVFLYDARALLETIDELAERGKQQDDKESESGLKDFGDELLPAFVERGKSYVHPLAGYWRDVGTIGSYWLAHQELLADKPPLQLDDPRWPIWTYGIQMLPARVEKTASIERSLLAPGSSIAGNVERSVIGPGVVIEAGATVRDSVIFEHVVISANATVERAIIDAGARIGKGARVGKGGEEREEGEALDKAITVVEGGSRVS